MNAVTRKLKPRDLREPFDAANALPVAQCNAFDTRSRSLIERSMTP
jgi:hypothetical protein